jgi:hypothetical protein
MVLTRTPYLRPASQASTLVSDSSCALAEDMPAARRRESGRAKSEKVNPTTSGTGPGIQGKSCIEGPGYSGAARTSTVARDDALRGEVGEGDASAAGGHDRAEVADHAHHRVGGGGGGRQVPVAGAVLSIGFARG